MENGDYRGMSDRKFEEQAGEKPAFKAAFEKTFKVIPWSEAIAAAPYLPPADRYFTHEEIAEGYDRIAREGWGVRIEEAPAWNSSLDGLPTDPDVWAFLAVYDGKDVVELIRGRADGCRFVPADGDEWDARDVVDIICWTAADERPEISLVIVKAGVAALERIERRGHGHPVEDWLHREALRAVVAGHPDAQAIAAAALESRAVKFTRYYS